MSRSTSTTTPDTPSKTPTAPTTSPKTPTNPSSTRPTSSRPSSSTKPSTQQIKREPRGSPHTTHRRSGTPLLLRCRLRIIRTVSAMPHHHPRTHRAMVFQHERCLLLLFGSQDLIHSRMRQRLRIHLL